VGPITQLRIKAETKLSILSVIEVLTAQAFLDSGVLPIDALESSVEH
jgi:hypothetical protein